MNRKRDGLVPIREAFGSLGGPVQVIREATPQALHHFTRFDQVNQLVAASEADADLGFMARLMALCSLPRTNPGKRLQYVRRNGPYSLVITATGLNKLPFGTLPRLLLAWVSTEGVKTQSPVLVLGKSLAEFMGKLDLHMSGGSNRGDRTRLRNQMDRLFNSTVSLVYEDRGPDGSMRVKDTFTSPVARKTHLVWNPRRPDEPVLWNSTIELGQDFFNEIIRHPVPLDMNILKAMKRSPLGLDFYLWLTYRTFTLNRPLRLSWRALYRQFGVEPDRSSNKRTVDYFRADCLRELTKIKTAWPDLHYTTAKGVLILSPSKPAIAPTTGPQRLVE